MGKKKNREFWESGTLNNATYRQYYDRLAELAMSMFEWKNLPDTIDARFLELTLFTNGHAVFFKEDDIGYVALRSANMGKFNIYGIPTKRRAYAVNGFQKDLTDKDSVIIYNNLLHKNSMLDTEMFARRLYNLDRIIDVNANAQKTPILLQTTEQQQLSLKNIYMQYDGNQPVIIADKRLNAQDIKAISTDAPYVADKIYTLKTQIWNEALTYLGISNINTTKKERLISDEVTRNQGGVVASRYSRLEARRQACEQINKMFGLNIECDYRDDYKLIADLQIEQFDDEVEEEVVDNE